MKTQTVFHYWGNILARAYIGAGLLMTSACTMELGIYELPQIGPFTVQSATAGKVNETTLAAAPFTGFCKEASQITVSSTLVPNIATFNCAAGSHWTQNVDLSALPSTFVGEVVFEAKTVTGATQIEIVDIDLDNVPPTVALNTLAVVNSVNQSSYPVSGTCSEDDSMVVLDLNGITKSIPCVAGNFATTVDLTSLVGASVVISATHSDPSANTRSASASVQRHTTIPSLSSFKINNDATTTTSTSVTLNASVTGATQMYITNTSGCSTGGSWITYAASSTWTLSTINATNTVYAKYRDNWGNETICTSDTIVHDNGAPTLSITSPLAGAVVNSGNVTAFTISGSCSEASRSITLTGPNSFTGTTTCNGTSFSAILNLSAIAQGNFQIDAELSDTAGNSTTASSPIYNKDTVSPTGSISIAGGAATTPSLGVTLTLSHSEAGQMYITNTAGCGANGTWETSTTSKSWTLSTASAVNTVYAKFRDAAGNESSCYSDTITHVATLASVSLSSPASGSFINLGNANSFTVSGACSEEGENVTIAVSGISDSTATCTSGAWSQSLNLSSLTDGSINFNISHSSATANQSFTKETVAPTINSFTINNGDAYTTSLSANLSIDVTGASEMYITDSALCLSGGTWETYGTSKSWTLPTANAVNTVYFKTRDTYGNESNCVSDSITHDSIIPTITIVGSVAGTWINNTNKSSFPMNGTCSELSKTFNLAVTSTAITKTVTCNSLGNWTTTVNMSTLADNAVTPYEIVVTSTRASGNSASAAATYFKDIVAPAVPTLSNLPIYSDVAMNITVNSSGMTQYQYFVILPGDVATTCTSTSTFSGSKISAATPITDSMSSAGTYKICTKAWDDAGNSATVSSATSVIHDTEGPKLLSVTSSAADGVYDVGTTIPIKIAFDENVTVTGTPQLTLETGSTDRVLNYTSGSGTSTLTFNYVVQTGDVATDLDYVSTSSLNLNGGTLKDSYGQDATITLPAPGSTFSLGGQKNISLAVTTGLTPIVKNYPTEGYTLPTISANVSGSNITHYKFAVINSGTCATATYGAATAKATTLYQNITALPEGPYTLCVIGGSSTTTFQPASEALSFPWTKDSISNVGITTATQTRVIEGGSDQTITVTMSAAKTYDVDVYYHVSGDAVNPTNHNIASGVLTFPAGTTTQSITVSFPENAAVEGEKLLNFYLTGTNGPLVSLTKKYIAQYFIKDNDSNLSIIDFKMSNLTACSITSDNALRCMGHNSNGQVGNGTTTFQSLATVITPGTGYASVAVGKDITCAITTLGAAYCWGNIEGVGTPNTPLLMDAANSYLSISVGDRHACGITTANKLRCWGRNLSYQLGDGTMTGKPAVSIDPTEDYKFITTGANNTCGITSGNVLKCWGESTNYALGTGTLIQTPTVVDGGESYKAVSIGTSHACAITTAGTMKCWGANDSSQLGDGTTTTSMTPVLVDSTPAYTQVSVSQTLNIIKNADYTCALTVAGTVKCWGYNTYQQLGDGTSTLQSLPVLSDGGALYNSIVVSGSRTCGITSDGALKCWGALEMNANQYTFGMQGTYFLPRFANIKTEFNFTQYSAHNYFGSEKHNPMCGLANSKIYCWGSNQTTTSYFGDFTSTNNHRTAPVLIDPNVNYSSIVESRQQDICAITTDGYIKCWGYNRYGEFGTGASVGTFTTKPVTIDAYNKYSKVASQYETVCGITLAGVLKCSGGNDSYQLGDGTTTHATTMTTVDPGVSYKDVVLGQSHVCGITTDDTLKCWGGNSSGQVGVNSTTNVTRPTIVDLGVTYKKIVAGPSWNCGITTTNKLKCWGGNGVSQLGTGDSTNRLIPTVIDSARDYMDVSTAWSNTCALETSGNLRCWGSDLYIGRAAGNFENGTANTTSTSPQSVDPGTTYNKVFVRQGASCGITSGGETRCAGRFFGSNMGVPDSGVDGLAATNPNVAMLHFPTYMHKWFGL